MGADDEIRDEIPVPVMSDDLFNEIHDVEQRYIHSGRQDGYR